MKTTRKRLMEMAGLINEENRPTIHAVSLDNMAGTTEQYPPDSEWDDMVWDDIMDMLDDKYSSKVTVEFALIDKTGQMHDGTVVVNDMDDYQDLEWDDEAKFRATGMTDDNVYDLMGDNTPYNYVT